MTPWDVSKLHLVSQPHDDDAELFILFIFADAGMKTLLKKYEPPKPEEVNIYKQKLERIHAELSTSSK